MTPGPSLCLQYGWSWSRGRGVWWSPGFGSGLQPDTLEDGTRTTACGSDTRTQSCRGARLTAYSYTWGSQRCLRCRPVLAHKAYSPNEKQILKLYTQTLITLKLLRKFSWPGKHFQIQWYLQVFWDMRILYKYLDVFVWRRFLVVLLSLFGLSLHLNFLKASFSLPQGCTDKHRRAVPQMYWQYIPKGPCHTSLYLPALAPRCSSHQVQDTDACI